MKNEHQDPNKASLLSASGDFEVLAPQKKAVRKHIPEGKAHVATRNFPSSAPQLQTKLGIKEGGDLFIMGFTDYQNQKRVAVLKRLNA